MTVRKEDAVARRKIKKKKKEKGPPEEELLLSQGIGFVRTHRLFGNLEGSFRIVGKRELGKGTAARVSGDGNIFLNKEYRMAPGEWAYVIAHCLLHLAFGHFTGDNMPGREMEDEGDKKTWKADCDIRLWNIACDIYIAKFLLDIKFGDPTTPGIASYYTGPLSDEREIYHGLEEQGFPADCHVFGVGAENGMDMMGLEEPQSFAEGEKDWYAERFAHALAASVEGAVNEAGGSERGNAAAPSNDAEWAANWFINHYPLLGGLASGFRIIYDYRVCSQNDIAVAAVDIGNAEIYVNPAAGLGTEELRFVLAHEFLHAGLQHYERCQGRDRHLWNIACDFVINGWLVAMDIGRMPERGCLYDPRFDNVSTEEAYDIILSDIRAYMKDETFRGYGKGDMMGGRRNRRGAMDLDGFYRSALQDGLEYHRCSGRGFIPAGLEEEIRALSMPPVPWDVKLAEWFDLHFVPVEKRRSYARPSRRQGSTPDIPRPRMVAADSLEHDRTFGVVIDTSGSMSPRQIGHALGAVASYAAERDVPFARVVFCDAYAYDAGYLSPEDIAGRVAVKGRGGTVLQPAVNLLVEAEDFPKDGPILIITDGQIESRLRVNRDHAFILPTGSRLPFRAKGDMFYCREMKEEEQ